MTKRTIIESILALLAALALVAFSIYAVATMPGCVQPGGVPLNIAGQQKEAEQSGPSGDNNATFNFADIRIDGMAIVAVAGLALWFLRRSGKYKKALDLLVGHNYDREMELSEARGIQLKSLAAGTEQVLAKAVDRVWKKRTRRGKTRPAARNGNPGKD